MGAAHELWGGRGCRSPDWLGQRDELLRDLSFQRYRRLRGRRRRLLGRRRRLLRRLRWFLGWRLWRGRAGATAGVRRIGPPHAMVAVALVPRIVIGAVRLLAGRVLVVRP